MDFEALSYVWGNNTLSRPIKTQKGTIWITQNCLNALIDLRSKNTSRLLWIDAICINQRNNEEKNHQVPLMSRIYATASQTLIYLGPRGAERALPLFKELERYWKGHLSPTGLTDEYLGDVERIVSKSWFHRVWVLQELANSKKALLFWGSTSITWRIFSDAVRLLYSSRSHSLPPTLRMKDSDPKPFYDLLDLVNCADYTHSSDPRDKVYALIGLLNTTVLHDIVPDYNKSVIDVNIDLVHSFVRLYNNLNILLFSAKKPEPVITEGGNNPKDLTTVRDPEQSFPTWVPDLRCSAPHLSRRIISLYRTKQYPSFERTVARPCISKYHSHSGPALEVSLRRYNNVGAYIKQCFGSRRKPFTMGFCIQSTYKTHHIQETDEICMIYGCYESLVLRAIENQHASLCYQLIAEGEKLAVLGEHGLTETRARSEKKRPVIPDPVAGRPLTWETACLV